MFRVVFNVDGFLGGGCWAESLGFGVYSLGAFEARGCWDTLDEKIMAKHAGLWSWI